MLNWRPLAVLALLLAAPGHAAELVVIASNQPSLKIGAVVDGGRAMEISKGASVTLISSTGKTIVLEGPYSGVPDPAAAPADGGLVQSLSRLIEQKRDPSTALAVFRGVDRRSNAERPDLWGIDIGRGDRYCLRRDATAFLWWEGARSGAIVSLSNAAEAGGGVRIRWPSPKRELIWPDTLELIDGATYVVRFRSGDQGKRLEVRFMPDLPSDPHRIAWMVEHGCDAQASRVLDALARGEL